MDLSADLAAILDLDSGTYTGSTNPDGSPTPDFLIWEAKVAVRVAVQDLLAAGRSLRVSIGVPAGHPMTATVKGLAMVKAGTNPGVQRRLDAYDAAREAFVNAAIELAAVDSTVDLRALLDW
ncbi:hypothetical protein ACQP10_38310 (plasmid) [Streptosporangium sandarakinum]|uniref:hypothetical protein n=1 Tax=Streptosporangium sandarakinum TaxID=1260955 RepID=UPI003D93DC43